MTVSVTAVDGSTATRRLARLNRTRPEIQGLRALAVLAVVLYHLWPTRLPGGYVGVDVFFVISGFLIIGHLMREIDGSGRVALVQFWARRARRLLPASLLVLLASAVAMLVWVPAVLWQQWMKEFAASALYVQNWVLASDSVDYLGAENSASPAQHFWSLSVEEQFYIFWPLIIIAALAISRRMRGVAPRRAVAVTLVVLVAGSFAASVIGVAVDPAPTYFATQSRAWEFGVGGILAIVAARPLVGHDRLRALVSWAGIVALGVTLVTFTGDTPFPGAAALLPVAGTLAVIWSGSPSRWWAPTTVASLRPVQWIGGVSYSFYLWHWPFIVILPFALGYELGFRSRVGILVLSLVLAWVTKVLVEDPVRSGVLASKPAWLSLGSTLAATALVVAGCGVVYVQQGNEIERQAAQTRAAIADAEACLGAGAVDDPQNCEAPYAPNILTNPAFAATDIGKGVEVDDKCKQTLTDDAVIACEIGDTKAPERSMALVGDSHAGVLLEALDLYGKQNGVKFTTYIKTYCAGTGVAAAEQHGNDADQSCEKWGRAVAADIEEDPEVSAVVYANFTRYYANAEDNPLVADDFLPMWQRMAELGKKVIAVRDTPGTNFPNVPECIAQNEGADDPCSTPRSLAIPASDPLVDAVGQDPRASLVDLSDVLCDPENCHTLIGGLVVYFDDNHMTATFSRTLASDIGEQIEAALP